MGASKFNHTRSLNLLVEKRYLSNREIVKENAVGNISEVAKIAKNVFMLIISIKPGITDAAKLLWDLVQNPTDPVGVITRFIGNYKDRLGTNYDKVVADLNKVKGNVKEFYDEIYKQVQDYIKQIS
jgi:hypothetical protein